LIEIKCPHVEGYDRPEEVVTRKGFPVDMEKVSGMKIYELSKQSQ